MPHPHAGEEHSYLLARSSLDDYQSFMRAYAVGGHELDRGRLVAEWRRADDRMAELRADEPDRADNNSPEPLPAHLRPLAAAVERDPVFRQAFSDATYEFAVVDLDRVIVSQRLVSLEHVARLHARLGRASSDEDLFHFCLPAGREPPAFRASRIADEEFAFRSESSDLRFLDAVLLRPDQLTGYHAVGPVAGVIALVVGFGSNYLNVLSVDGRLVLNNGHHRACALWDLGHRRVPCVIHTITHPDEIPVHAPRAVRRQPEVYLTGPRPPLVGDYFDTLLSRRVPIALTAKEVRVRYAVDEKDVP
jgi:hypothetical protein